MPPQVTLRSQKMPLFCNGAQKRAINPGMRELWSFVGHKDNKQWMWSALDRERRRIVGFISVTGVVREPSRYGRHSHRSIANVRCAIPTFGRPMRPFFRAYAIEPWAKRPGKPATLSDLMARYDSEYLA